MENPELLKAIGNLLDEKLQPIKNQLVQLNERMDRIEERMTGLEKRVGKLEKTTEELQYSMKRQEEAIVNLDARLQIVERQTGILVDKVIRLEEYSKKLQTTIDVELLPRVRTIESCYLDTYKRYQDGIEKMKELETDVIVLKQTVHNHSVKLLMIS